MADDPPELKIVAESPPYEIEKAHALRELAWDTREMAANLLRVMRGAGRPHDLPQQIINLSEAILEVSKSARTWAVSSAIQETLQSAIPGGLDASEREDYIGTIASGSLQLLASTLVHQGAQAASGEREIAMGIRELERAQEREREKFREEQEEMLAQLRRPARPASVRTARRSPKPRPPEALPSQPDPVPGSTAEFMKARRRALRGEE